MRIVLLHDVKDVGKKGEIKEVSQGYARNFLIPRNLAVPYDKHGVLVKQEFDAQEQRLHESQSAALKRLLETVLVFEVTTGKHGEMFQSITQEMIKKELENRGFHEARALLKEHLKALGDYTVEVALGRGVKGSVRVSVRQRAS